MRGNSEVHEQHSVWSTVPVQQMLGEWMRVGVLEVFQARASSLSLGFCLFYQGPPQDLSVYLW